MTLHDVLAVWNVPEIVRTRMFKMNEAFWEFICVGQTLETNTAHSQEITTTLSILGNEK
jgi:hypothetical protein